MLLTGTSVADPPANIPAGATVQICRDQSDSGPNANILDNCFFDFVAFWNQLSLEPLNDGDFQLGGGAEWVDPLLVTTFDLFEVDGVLDCLDSFGFGGSGSGQRLFNDDGQCGSLIPYSATQDADGFGFFAEVGLQNPTFAFQLCFAFENRDLVVTNRLQSFRAPPPDPETCLDTPPCPNGPPCPTPSCSEVLPCEGQPVYQCSGSGDRCTVDSDCLGGQSCNLVNLVPPTGGFPDLDNGVLGTNYGCWTRIEDTYLGASGVCSDSGETSCTVDADCPESESCVLSGAEQFQRCQDIFITDDWWFRARR